MRFKLIENRKLFHINRALWGDPSGKIRTFGIVSPQNPLGWKDSTDEECIRKYKEYTIGVAPEWLTTEEKRIWWGKDTNKKQVYNSNKLQELKRKIREGELLQRFINRGNAALKRTNAPYAEIKGYFGEPEKSLIIFNVCKDEIEEIARDYGQLSYFYGIVDKDHSTIAYYITTDSFKTYHRESISATVFSEKEVNDFFSKYGKKFNIGMNVFDDAVPEVIDDRFEESLNENRPPMVRSVLRRQIYRRKKL